MIPRAHVQTILDLWREGRVRAECALEGDCMAPLLRDGDRLVVEHGSRDVRFGDIVAFRSQGRVLVHRVVRIDRRDGRAMYEVAADRQPTFLPAITDDDLIGTIREARGSNGHLVFESFHGRCVNLVLGWRSYVGARCRDRRSWLSTLLSKLPGKSSISLLPLELVGFVKRDRRRIDPSCTGGDGRGETF